MLWINETLLSPLRQRNDEPLVGWGCVLCPCGLGGVGPFACGWPLAAVWLLPSCPRAPAPRGRGAVAEGLVMFALPALFPTLALFDDVPVLVAVCSFSFPGKAWAMESKSSLRHTWQLQSPLPPFPACPSSSSIPTCTPGVCGGSWVGVQLVCVALLGQDVSLPCLSPPAPVTAQTSPGVPSRHGPIQLFVVVAIFSLSMQYPIALLPQLDNVP